MIHRLSTACPIFPNFPSPTLAGLSHLTPQAGNQNDFQPHYYFWRTTNEKHRDTHTLPVEESPHCNSSEMEENFFRERFFSTSLAGLPVAELQDFPKQSKKT